MSIAMQTVLVALAELPVVSVALLNGAAIGGGAEVAIACDHRVGNETATLRFVQARLGIAPGWGGTRNLLRNTCPAVALSILTDEGTVRSRPDAHAIFSSVSHTGEEALQEYLGARDATPTASIRAVKAQRNAALPTTECQIQAEARAFAARWRSPEHMAALAKWGAS